MNRNLLFSIFLLTGCAGLSSHAINQQCYFDKESCKQHLSDFNDYRTKFKTDGAYLALYDTAEQKYVEELDTGLKNNYYYQKNIVNLLNLESVSTPNAMFQNYVTFINNSKSEVTNKKHTKILQMLRKNVAKGPARNANSQNCEVYGITATDYKNKSNVVSTFLGHFIKDDKTYAIIVTFDNPKPLKSTYGFNTSGWNATKLAGKIINNVCEKP